MKRSLVFVLLCLVLTCCASAPKQNGYVTGEPYTVTVVYESERCSVVVVQEYDEKGNCLIDNYNVTYY